MEMVWRRWLREGKEDLSRIDSFVDIIMRVATRLGVAAEFFLNSNEFFIVALMMLFFE